MYMGCFGYMYMCIYRYIYMYNQRPKLFLTFHSIWNYKEVRTLMPNASFITILRDPVACFESNYVYMGLQRDFGMDINQFAGSEVPIIIFNLFY